MQEIFFRLPDGTGCPFCRDSPMPKHGSLVSSKVMLKLKLSVDSSYDAGTYGAATLTDSETQAFLDSDQG